MNPPSFVLFPVLYGGSIYIISTLFLYVLSNKYKEYKIGNNKVVKLEIKRDTVVASFIFIDAELRKYSRENKVAIKQKATPVKILSSDDVSFAKDSIDMVIKQIEDDILAKKELQKERRRKKKIEAES